MSETSDENKLKLSLSPRGNSGTPITSMVYLSEYLADLVGVSGHEIYNKMRRSDPQVRKIMAAIYGPIKAADFTVEPASIEPRDIEAAALMDHILFRDIPFKKKILNEILTFLPHGYSAFEVVHENRINKEFGPYTGLNCLGFRNQTTLTEWKVDAKTSALQWVKQKVSGDNELEVEIPKDNLLLFINEQEGDDNGFPLLRPLYGPYKRKLITETLKMIGIEKFAIGTPTLTVPKDVKPTDVEYIEAIRVLNMFVSGHDAYLAFPEGWLMDLHGNDGFDPMKLEDSIKREDEKMAGAILATFLELGTGGNGGAFALGENLEKFFSNVVNSFAKVITDTINTELIPNLMALNYGDEFENFPAMKCSGINDRVGKELMEIVTGYTNAGVISKDESLHDYLRRSHGLPNKDEGALLDNGESLDDGNPDDTPPDTDNTNSGNDNDEQSDQIVDEDVQLSETVKLAETPKKLMETQRDDIREAMRSNLVQMKDKLIFDVMKKYKSLPESGKLKAVDNIKIGYIAQYKRQLKGILTTTATKALADVRKEVPAASNTKLAANDSMLALLDEVETVKFVDNDFSALPAHVRKLLQLQANRIVDKQAADLADRVSFQFMSTSQTSDSVLAITKEIDDAATAYIDAGAIDTASQNVASTVVNQTRNEFFYAPEVLEQIYAFKFNNFDPVAAICKKLAGKVFSKDDAEFLSYSPPLHHNCKSYVTAVTNSAKVKPEIEPLPPISKEDRKSKTLSEYERLANMVDILNNEGEDKL